MTEPQPASELAGPRYVPAPEVVVVRVTVRGGVHHGQVIGWRGERVYMSYRTVDGNDLAWVPADEVERLTT